MGTCFRRLTLFPVSYFNQSSILFGGVSNFSYGNSIVLLNLFGSLDNGGGQALNLGGSSFGFLFNLFELLVNFLVASTDGFWLLILNLIFINFFVTIFVFFIFSSFFWPM